MNYESVTGTTRDMDDWYSAKSLLTAHSQIHNMGPDGGWRMEGSVRATGYGIDSFTEEGTSVS